MADIACGILSAWVVANRLAS